mgnify:CR=1 FL=1
MSGKKASRAKGFGRLLTSGALIGSLLTMGWEVAQPALAVDGCASGSIRTTTQTGRQYGSDGYEFGYEVLRSRNRNVYQFTVVDFLSDGTNDARCTWTAPKGIKRSQLAVVGGGGAGGSRSGGGGGGSGAVRVTETETTSSIANGSSASVQFATLGKSFSLQKVTVDKQCWVRIYSDTAARTADATRSQGTDPADGSGVIAEIISTTAGTQVFKMTPAIIGWLDNSETTVPVAVQNNSGSTGTVTVTIDALKLES